MHDVIHAETAEVQQLRAAVLVLSIALACATSRTPTLGDLMKHWTTRRPITQAELDKLAAVWTLEPEPPPGR